MNTYQSGDQLSGINALLILEEKLTQVRPQRLSTNTFCQGKSLPSQTYIGPWNSVTVLCRVSLSLSFVIEVSPEISITIITRIVKHIICILK